MKEFDFFFVVSGIMFVGFFVFVYNNFLIFFVWLRLFIKCFGLIILFLELKKFFKDVSLFFEKLFENFNNFEVMFLELFFNLGIFCLRRFLILL